MTGNTAVIRSNHISQNIMVDDWLKGKRVIDKTIAIICQKIDDTEIEEYKFHQQKNLVLINNLDINKIVVSFKFLFGKQDFKYFISYKDFEKIGHLCIFCPLMVMCKRSFDENRRI